MTIAVFDSAIGGSVLTFANIIAKLPPKADYRVQEWSNTVVEIRLEGRIVSSEQIIDSARRDRERVAAASAKYRKIRSALPTQKPMGDPQNLLLELNSWEDSIREAERSLGR